MALPPTSPKPLRLGLTLCALSAACAVDWAIALTDKDGPPVPVSLLGILLALVTLAGVALAWQDRTGGVPLVVAGRILGGALSVTGFFNAPPAWVYATAGATVVLALAGLGLIFVREPARRAG